MSEVLCCEHIRDVNSPSSNPSDPTGKSNDDDADDDGGDDEGPFTQHFAKVLSEKNIFCMNLPGGTYTRLGLISCIIDPLKSRHFSTVEWDIAGL